MRQREWRFCAFSQRALDARIKITQRFRALLEKDLKMLAQTLSTEMGKPIQQSQTEIRNTLARIDFFTTHVPELLITRQVRQIDNINESIRYEPLGVIANISAWNYPYFVGSNVFVPALLCGNCVLYKPSEYTLQTGLEIERLWQEAGLAPDVFQTLVGDGNTAEALLAPSLTIDGVFFTGSYATGKKISEKLAGRMIPLQLELGGKDAVYVHSDVGHCRNGGSVSSWRFLQ